MTQEPYPTMPVTEAEWRTHVAFYRLTVKQRDAAWRQIERLGETVDRLRREVDLYREQMPEWQPRPAPLPRSLPLSQEVEGIMEISDRPTPRASREPNPHD